jgi:hypothetical protein
LVAAFLALAGAVGCGSSGGGGGSAAIATTPLSGKIGGQSWTLGTAETDPFLSMTGPNFFVTMYPDTDLFTACTGQPAATTDNLFLPDIPMATGDYSLSATPTGLHASFQVGNTANVATSGHLVIDSVSATTVTGGINTTFDSDNTLDGQFTITVCP